MFYKVSERPRPRLDWKGEIVPRVKSILVERRAEGIPTATLRGVFYILVSLEMLPNIQQRYKSLSKALVIARRTSVLPSDWIVDESRDIIDIDDDYFSPEEHVQGLFASLAELPDRYITTIPRWHKQPNYVEIWVEKNAMAGVFSSVLSTSRQVRIVPNGGWSSFSFENNNIKRLQYYQSLGKRVYVLYYGDYDPSGTRMVTKLETSLVGMGIHFVHVAITKEQIQQFGLQNLTNPDPAVASKLERDPNAARFKRENGGRLFQIELDALSALKPEELKRLLQTSVDMHFNEDIYTQVLAHPKHSAIHIKRLVRNGIKNFNR